MSAADIQAVAELRQRYWLNGYRPVAVYTGHKRPIGKGWLADAMRDPPLWATWQPIEAALSTGIATGRLVGVDVDVLIQPVVDRIVFEIQAGVCATPLVRIGRAPKTLLCFRCDGDPFRKLQTEVFIMPDGSEAKVELLAEGQQFVADGIHPDTGLAYLWPAGSPETVPLVDVPAITLEQAQAIVDAARALLIANGGVPKKKPQKERPRRERTPSGCQPEGHTFFAKVNSAALGNLDAWAPDVFPTAVYQSGTGAYRVASADLGRDLEEDISLHPAGIQDFGREHGMTAIDVVVEFGEASSPVQAALWLCGKLGLDPAQLGWRNSVSGNSGAVPPHAASEPLPNGAYLRPEDTNLPPLHLWITESRADAEARLRHSIRSFFATAERVLPARKERQRRREAGFAAATLKEGRELTPIEKAAITRRVTAEVAADYGFPGKTIPQPVVQLESGSQGNGKTDLSLKGIAAIRADLTVRKYAPTLERAEEDLKEYRKVATEGSMPGFVVRGRTALDPLAAGATMCRRPAVTERAAKLGLSPALTICPGCPFAGKCGTKRQERTIAALGTRAVFFVNREYAHLPCPAPTADIVIGDEIMTLPAVVITGIEPAKLVGELVPFRGRNLAEVMEARRILERLRPVLTSAQPLAAVRDACIDKKQLQLLHRLLDQDEEPSLYGSMPDAAIDAELDRIDHPDQRHAYAIVGATLREIEMPRATFNAVKYSKRRDLIRAAGLRGFADGIKSSAVLLLDGTADLELNEKLTRSTIVHNVVRMERDAEIYGTIGKRYSRQSITGKNTKGEDLSPDRVDAAKRLRDDIGTIVSHFDTPLLTATKQAEEALVEGGHLPADVMTSHGGMTRSINKWDQGRHTAIDVAPDAASIEDLELIAGAFYARDPVPIVSMAQMDDLPDDWPYKPWPYRASRLRRFADGKLQVVHVDVHPDPRVDRILRQITDANIIQNLDRVRPIYNHRDLVALNERVLDLTYSRVSRHREMVEGGPRIDRVLKKTNGILPLTPATLAALFPAEAGSVSTARRAIRAWRKWGHGPNVTPIYPLTPFSYRVPGQPGRSSVVLVSTHHDDPKAAAEAVLGPVVAFAPALVSPPPQHPQAPPADATAAASTPRKGGVRPAGAPRSPTSWRLPAWMPAAAAYGQVRAPPDG